MAGKCGYCANYRERPLQEDVCIKSGKIVPFLAQRDCFVEKLEGLEAVLPPIVIKTKKQRNRDKEKPKVMEYKNTARPGMKICKECGRELPLEAFGKQYRSRDGHLHICRDCMSKKQSEASPRKKKDEDEAEPNDTPLETILDYSDLELKEELISRGWDVTCTKTISL